MRTFALAGLAAIGLALFAAPAVKAQIPMNYPSPVSYYTPPPAWGVYLPPTVRVTNYYMGAGNYYPIPNATVGYFSPSAAIVAPARVWYTPFGQTVVRTPMYRVKF